MVQRSARPAATRSCQVARGIGGGAVDLGRVLAREGAAAMRGRATIGIDDDLAPSQAAIAVGAADDETAGRVDVELGLFAHPALGQDLEDMRADNFAIWS